MCVAVHTIWPNSVTTGAAADVPTHEGLPEGLPVGLPEGLPAGLPVGLPEGLRAGLAAVWVNVLLAMAPQPFVLPAAAPFASHVAHKANRIVPGAVCATPARNGSQN